MWVALAGGVGVRVGEADAVAVAVGIVGEGLLVGVPVGASGVIIGQFKRSERKLLIAACTSSMVTPLRPLRSQFGHDDGSFVPKKMFTHACTSLISTLPLLLQSPTHCAAAGWSQITASRTSPPSTPHRAAAGALGCPFLLPLRIGWLLRVIFRPSSRVNGIARKREPM